MARRLDARAADFKAQFARLVEGSREADEDVSRAVAAIIDDVRARGDAALIELSARFDHVTLTKDNVRVSRDEIEDAYREAARDVKDALHLAAARIEDYHRRQLPLNESFTDDTGAKLGWRWSAIEAVGLYVPGGTASYPSSVLMNAVPARVAGVARVVMVTPATGGKINPLTLAAAKIAGVAEIYRVGGAQAVAALATARRRLHPSTKSSARAIPMWRQQSARSSAASASIPLPVRRKFLWSRMAGTIQPGSPPTFFRRRNMIPRRSRF
jgi:histidinol dehydrogenase